MRWGEAKRNAANQGVMRNGNPVVVIVFGMTIFLVAAAPVMEVPVAAVPAMEAPEVVAAPAMEVPEAVEVPVMVVPAMTVVLAAVPVVVNIPEKVKVLRNIPVHRNHQNLISMILMMMAMMMCTRMKIMTRIGITRMKIMPMAWMMPWRIWKKKASWIGEKGEIFLLFKDE